MLFIPMTKKEFETKRPYTKYYDKLVEFRDSNAECVMIVGWTNSTAKSCANSIYNSIRRYKMDKQIRVSVRKGEVYLLKV